MRHTYIFVWVTQGHESPTLSKSAPPYPRILLTISPLLPLVGAHYARCHLKIALAHDDSCSDPPSQDYCFWGELSLPLCWGLPYLNWLFLVFKEQKLHCDPCLGTLPHLPPGTICLSGTNAVCILVHHKVSDENSPLNHSLKNKAVGLQ